MEAMSTWCRRLPRGGGSEQTACAGQGRDDRNRCPAAERVGEEAGEQRSDDESAIAPEAVDADDRGAVARLHDIRDGGDQGRVDERRAGPEQHRGRERRAERSAARDKECERARLYEHPERDQWFPPGTVREP